MKNIHILPTDKPSRIIIFNDNRFDVLPDSDYRKEDLKIANFIPQNIYITNDEEIKEKDWCLFDRFPKAISKASSNMSSKGSVKKIILTTDQDLIKDGVQPIDDEFLKWFVKNPSCEEVEIFYQNVYFIDKWERKYKILIPKEESYTKVQQKSLQLNKKFAETVDLEKIMSGFEESKQETLEEAGLKHCDILDKFPALGNSLFSFKEGAKWQRERSYSEEDIQLAFEAGYDRNTLESLEIPDSEQDYINFGQWFAQFKKK